MSAPARTVVALLCAFLMCAFGVANAGADDEEHFLDYTEDKYKVNFISGNLTASVTVSSPWVVLWHTTDPFSPTFDLRFLKVYLFNDTDRNGVFSRSEAVYTSYLDADHVTWNHTSVEFVNETAGNECARFMMNATLSLYGGPENETVVLADWANVTFWFSIAEHNITFTNSIGSYLVRGVLDLRINFTLEVLEPIDAEGLAVEQLLSGGGSNSMFTLKERGSHSRLVDSLISSRVDETQYGDDFTHIFQQTPFATQEVAYSKEDGTEQVLLFWDSVPLCNASGAWLPIPSNASYYTTGTGMILHTAYPLPSCGALFQSLHIGINEAGFVQQLRDWFMDNLAAMLVVAVALPVAIFSTVFLMRRVRRRAVAKQERAPDDPKENE
ncbi:MAG: hypothetical protein QXU73_08185 [Thermoplasmata archaeon]